MKKNTYALIAFFSLLFFSSSAYCSDDLISEDYSLFGAAGKIVLYLLALALVLFLTYYGTKFIARHSKKLGKGNNIEILDQFSFGSNNKILVAKIYRKIYVLSVNNNQTSVIDKLSEKDINLEDQESLVDNRDFEKQLDSIMDSIDDDSGESGLNDKLVNMKMKVLKLKNDKYNNQLDKEEENE
ncbi:flagellar biosynthetic protein FliO [Sporosalibacterium faouarense]|uniref:flagellar biosynthetic protein FliO n=1 Tax=Sporosalibacterium faouarense TaxID=516123 RepID=UPI00141C80BD|nr:flagellar biosynthetic protein FliO [Sporosalibacterium faouarense]MTI48003.1 flagellar biosynthetic protein FliO [Bacillota bacterium]